MSLHVPHVILLVFFDVADGALHSFDDLLHVSLIAGEEEILVLGDQIAQRDPFIREFLEVRVSPFEVAVQQRLRDRQMHVIDDPMSFEGPRLHDPRHVSERVLHQSRVRMSSIPLMFEDRAQNALETFHEHLLLLMLLAVSGHIDRRY